MKHLALFLCFLLPFALNGDEKSEIRIFKSSDGREMEAALTLVSGDDVFIERRDGLATKVDISVFSSEDQEFIREWGRQQALKTGGMEIRFKSNTEDRSGWEGRGGVLSKKWKEGYELVITNNTYKDIKDVRIEYLMLKFEDAIAAQRRSDGEIKRIKQTVTVPLIKARSDASAETEVIDMLETKLASGYYWSGGGKKKSEDELKGIWARVYVDDTLIYEVSQPENMIRTEVW